MQKLKYSLHCVDMCFSLDAVITLKQQRLADIIYILTVAMAVQVALFAPTLPLVFTL